MWLIILEEVDAALEFLYEDCLSCILHRNLKSNNVLFNADFKAYTCRRLWTCIRAKAGPPSALTLCKLEKIKAMYYGTIDCIENVAILYENLG